jgi:pyruvate kinase
MRKAKIICTLGPASDAPGVLEAMVRAGMDVARLNFSHGTWAEQRRRLLAVRAAAKKVGRPVAVLQDLQGPKIRVGTFEGGGCQLTAGTEVVVTTRDVRGHAGVIPTPIQILPRDVRKGDPILLDDGRIRLRALEVRKRDVRCEVEVGGRLKDRKGLNLPGAAMSVQTLTEKDLADLDFGMKLQVDAVALSFVRSPDDLALARARMGKRAVPLIAKIEKPQAVERLTEIALAAEGIMVARGDLGVELPLERLPAIQKAALREANGLGKLTVVATEMLESMINQPRPTRAEVSDVANAILDGADAVMLSGETAVGAHPVAAVATMARIVEETEKDLVPTFVRPFAGRREVSTGVAAAAVAATDQLESAILVAYTESGETARLISELRPRARILALTPSEATFQRLALYWGIQPLRVRRLHSTDAMVRQVRRLCQAQGLCQKGDHLVIVAGVPLNAPGNTNLMTIQHA